MRIHLPDHVATDLIDHDQEVITIDGDESVEAACEVSPRPGSGTRSARAGAAALDAPSSGEAGFERVRGAGRSSRIRSG